MKPLFLLLLMAASLSAAAQQAPPAATAQPAYGSAELESRGDYWYLRLADGTRPNPGYNRYVENGKERQFADEAAILNFLYGQGWDIPPNGTYASQGGPLHYHRYLLKRRTL